MKASPFLLRMLAVMTAVIVSWPLRAAPVPTIITDDFSTPANWNLFLETPASVMTLADNRLNFTCPSSTDEQAADGIWNGATLPVDRDWSIRCRAHVSSFSLTTVDQWIVQSFGVGKTADMANSSVGVEFFRDDSPASSDGFSLTSLARINGASLPNLFYTKSSSPDIGLRIDFSATARTLTCYSDCDGAGSSSGWVRVGVIDLGQGTYNLNLTASDTFTVFLREAAQNVAVTAGMAYFSGFEEVVDPGFDLTEYYLLAVIGTVSLYSGRDWEGGVAHTQLQVTDTSHNLDLYSGTTNPTQYFRPVVKLDYTNGDLSEGAFVPRPGTAWTEYSSRDGGLGLLGWDTPPDESGRTPGLFFPSQMGAGQRVEWSLPWYAFGAYSGSYHIAIELIGREIVTLSGGAFPDCLHLRYRVSTDMQNDPAAQVYDEWWARGVGIVRYQGISGYGSSQLRELVSYTNPDLSPAVKNVAVGGGSYSVSYTHTGSWLVDESLDWATVSATSGTGNATLTISVAPNTGLPRQGMVNIGGTAHWIFQAGTNAPVFTTQPLSKEILPNSTWFFTVAAAGSPAPTYRWQRLPAGSSTWADLSDTATYTGTASTALVVDTATLAMNGDQFRCVATSAAGTATSGAATLGVSGASPAVWFYQVAKVRLVHQTDAATVISPSTEWGYSCGVYWTSIDSIASGTVMLPAPVSTGRTLTWQGDHYKLPEEGYASQALLDAAMPAGNYVFDVVTSTGAHVGRTVAYPAAPAYPDPVRVLDYAALQDIDASVPCTITWTSWAAGTGNDTYSVFVEDAPRTARIYENDMLAPEFGGTATSATIPAGKLQPGRTYWLSVGPTKVYSPTNRQVPPDSVVTTASTSTRLPIRTRAAAGAPMITAQPLAQAARVGTTATFAVVASGTGLTYKWLRLLPGATEWTELAASSTFAGVTTAMLTVSGVTLAMSGEQYRCVVSNGVGPNASDPAKLTVHEETFITFGGWAAGMFTPTQLADPAVSGPNADLGATGASNLLRYAFDLPAPGTRLAGPVAPVTVVPFGGANYLSVAIHRKSYDPTLRYIVEGSADLANWTTITTLEAGYPRDVAVRDNVATSAAARRFLRVRVEIVP